MADGPDGPDEFPSDDEIPEDPLTAGDIDPFAVDDDEFETIDEFAAAEWRHQSTAEERIRTILNSPTPPKSASDIADIALVSETKARTTLQKLAEEDEYGDEEPRYPGWTEEEKEAEIEKTKRESAQQFIALQKLLDNPELARFYTDLLIHSPTTVTAVRDRQGFSRSTAYEYAHKLAELGVAEELEEREDGSELWGTDPVSGHWTTEIAFELGPVLIAAYGATGVDDELELFVDRHGKETLVSAVTATIEYLKGNTTRRGVARKLDIPAAAGIAVTQSIEPIIAIVGSHDPMLNDVTLEVDVHERALEQSPYR
jgi:hypothetical protein